MSHWHSLSEVRSGGRPEGNSDSQSGTNDDLVVPEQSGLERKGRTGGPAELAAVKIQELERHKAKNCSKVTRSLSEKQFAIYSGETALLELAIIKNFEATGKQQKSQGGVKRQLSTARLCQ